MKSNFLIVIYIYICKGFQTDTFFLQWNVESYFKRKERIAKKEGVDKEQVREWIESR